MKLNGVEKEMNMKLPFSFKLEWNFKHLVQSKVFVSSFYLLCLSPLIVCIFVIKEKSNRYEELSQQLEYMGIRIEKTLETQKDRNDFFLKYREVDRYYLDHVLEAATFLKEERETLELVCGHPAFESCGNIKNRLTFLTKGDNQLIFSEGNRHSKNHLEEVDLKQKRLVEINSEDLRKLLSMVEGVSIGENHPIDQAPQLIMRRFMLRRKKLTEKETFLLDMHLIKREVIK
jgi:hypothetical protein